MSSQVTALALALYAMFVPIAQSQVLQQRPAPPVPPTPKQSEAPTPRPSNLELPTGTSLQVESPRANKMKAGEPIEANLLYPLFLDGKMVVPKGTLVKGEVTALTPDPHMRLHARLRGDFTPFHIPQVRFDQLVLPDGQTLPLSAPAINNGAPVLELSSPGLQPHRSVFVRGWDMAKNQVRQPIEFFTQPGFGDRALQVFYHQLPYHPERIAPHTAWSFELAQPVPLPNVSEQAASSPPNPTSGPEVWSVHALLKNPVGSATSKVGEPVRALVVEPVFNREHELVVPQGSVLVGKVTQATAAKSLGRNGQLRFSFQQVQFPEGTNRAVESSLAGATTDKRQDLSIDAEGTVTPRNKSSVIVPLALTLLAGRALDEDNLTAHAAVASNGFGFIGRIVGTAAGSKELAAGIGYYAAALSVYENWLAPGRDVVFPLDTRIEIQTSPLRAPVLTSAVPPGTSN